MWVMLSPQERGKLFQRWLQIRVFGSLISGLIPQSFPRFKEGMAAVTGRRCNACLKNFKFTCRVFQMDGALMVEAHFSRKCAPKINQCRSTLHAGLPAL